MLLDLITTSDMGYTDTILEDHMNYWDHVIRLENEDKEEKTKYLNKVKEE